MQDAAPDCISLADLAPGRRARLCEHPPRSPVPLRLEELGFVPGTVVEILRCAPLGDPVEIELRGYRVCLRRADLAGLCAVLERVRR
jgi:ferrous iron transport protein A